MTALIVVGIVLGVVGVAFAGAVFGYKAGYNQGLKDQREFVQAQLKHWKVVT